MRRSPKPPTHAPAVGQKVDYYDLLAHNRPPTHPGAVVHTAARLLGGHTWVIGINGKAGCVSLDHCRPSKDEPALWPEFTFERAYTIVWEISLTAADAHEAAEKAYTMMREPTGHRVFHCADEFGIKTRVDLDRVRAAALVTAEEIEAAGGRFDAGHHLRGRK